MGGRGGSALCETEPDSSRGLLRRDTGAKAASSGLIASVGGWIRSVSLALRNSNLRADVTPLERPDPRRVDRYQRPETGRRYALRLGQTFVLGRSREVAMRLLDDPLISRRHASIELRRDGLFVTDLGSRNGTLAAGQPLPPNQPVNVADAKELSLGNHVFALRVVGLGEEVEVVPTGYPDLPKEEFEILGLIGEGTTGRVFAAEQLLLRRKVAVKVLNDDLAQDPIKRERFLREGWICSQITSPRVVDIYDLVTSDQQVCMIMEMVQGPSARDRLADGPLPLAEVARIGEDVALALQAAQEAGIVHRDVKPSNILLDPRGVAKLTDFGIAKTGGWTPDKNAETPANQPALTPRGRGMGTMAYVSPEQALDAGRVDIRSDVYALGATLFHLASGQPPFAPTSPSELFQTFEQEPPRLSDMVFDSALPRALVDLIHRMLAKDPEGRPNPPSEIARALQAIRREHFARGSGSGSIYETGAHPRMGSAEGETPQ